MAMDRRVDIQLAPREMQVLELLWCGLVIKEIAANLGLTYARVKQVRLTLGHKLGVANSWQLARRALELGLIKL